MSINEIDDTNVSESWQNELVLPSIRYIATKVAEHTVTFPDVLVSEIMIIERNTILVLPFYEPSIVGVIHHQAHVIPLMLLRLLMGEQRAMLTESLTVVVLGKISDNLSIKSHSGVGIIVDRVVGSITTEEHQKNNLQPSINSNLLVSSKAKHKKINQIVANIKETEYTPIEIILSSVPTHIWQPQRWHHST